jgi:hypothetical protein
VSHAMRPCAWHILTRHLHTIFADPGVQLLH